jgi:hypothetical protein
MSTSDAERYELLLQNYKDPAVGQPTSHRGKLGVPVLASLGALDNVVR